MSGLCGWLVARGGAGARAACTAGTADGTEPARVDGDPACDVAGDAATHARGDGHGAHAADRSVQHGGLGSMGGSVATGGTGEDTQPSGAARSAGMGVGNAGSGASIGKMNHLAAGSVVGRGWGASPASSTVDAGHAGSAGWDGDDPAGTERRSVARAGKTGAVNMVEIAGLGAVARAAAATTQNATATATATPKARAAGATSAALPGDAHGLASLGIAQARLAQMAMPLSRLDGAPVRSHVDWTGAVAVVAPGASGQLYEQDGLVVAIWGRPALDGSTHEVARRLASLWLSRGVAACACLSGPFALALLDDFSGSALLAVDRAGMHTLSYTNNAHGLFFASSHDALLAHPAVRGALDPQALYNYLFFHMVPGPATAYVGQQRLLPGEYLHVRAGRQCKGSYWQLAFQENTYARMPDSFAAKQQQFLHTLRVSVESSLGEDAQRTGAFLSGGTDSSTIAAIVGQVTGRPARTYSIGFDAPGYDEMAYARLAASHAGSVHHERYVTAADVLAAIPAMAAAFDQPFGNASAIPAFYCAQMARADGVTRMLGGDGGDELFGGNERYAHQAMLSGYERLPAMLRQVIIEPLLFRERAGKPWRLADKARRYIEQASMPLPARLESYNLLLHHGHRTVLEEGFIDTIDPGVAPGCLNGAYWQRQGEGLSQINQLLALDMRFTLADNDLVKVRTACELAGVEAAFPFLHDEMVAFAAGLAPRDKLDGRQLRPFFKRALAGILPPAIVRKKKHGFGLPFGLWLHSHVPLREFAFDNLTQLRGRGIVRPAFIDDLQGRLLAEHPAYHGTMVWLLLMLEQWLSHHPAALGSLDGGFAASAIETPAVLDPTA